MKPQMFIRTGILLAVCAITNFTRAQIPMPGPQRPTNGPPLVRIATPQDGQAFLLGDNIPICAASQNFTDTVVRVEFFEGANSLGVVTNRPIVWGRFPGVPPPPEYSCITWTKAAAGAYVLTAQATDRAGITVTSAPVDISVVTNFPPRVRIVRPEDGALILGPTNVTVCASAFDPNGTVASVEFFEGTNKLGVVTNPPVVWTTNHQGVFPIRQTAYCLTWSNVPPGTYSLTATATDNSGASTTSAAVDITVVTNLPPQVQIVTPCTGARVYAPANIQVCAVAKDADGTVASVELFEGTNSLGVLTHGVTVTNSPHQVQTWYCLTWSNVPAATYTLTAVATDNGGATGSSGPVEVTVVPPLPPLVRIVHPENGARFAAPADIKIATVTRYFTNAVASVQFLAGTNTLGTVTNSSSPAFHWTNVPAGAYRLTAVAHDSGGISATSRPVNISVVTNRLPRRPLMLH
jgi:hypothetical protein